jgi:hypothetical protein
MRWPVEPCVGTVGRVHPHLEIKIVDGDDRAAERRANLVRAAIRSCSATGTMRRLAPIHHGPSLLALPFRTSTKGVAFTQGASGASRSFADEAAIALSGTEQPT